MSNVYFSEKSLDDAMRCALKEILSKGNRVTATKGENTEIVGASLEIENPRARLSRTESRGKPFSPLGELCWYLAKDNSLEFIEYYIARYASYADDGIVHGGYGPRLFGWRGLEQFPNVARLLREKRSTRKAVIQLYDCHDIAGTYKDVPCTCMLQFLIRGDVLHLLTYMRSNDIFWGFPHDVFCFTMLQELMARDLGVELGSYRHFAGSLHLYDSHLREAEAFMDEGWQQTDLHMPPMPLGDPWPSVNRVLRAERKIRTSAQLTAGDVEGLDQYWLDLVRLLQIYRCLRDKVNQRASDLRDELNFDGFRSLVDRRLKT